MQRSQLEWTERWPESRDVQGKKKKHRGHTDIMPKQTQFASKANCWIGAANQNKHRHRSKNHTATPWGRRTNRQNMAVGKG